MVLINQEIFSRLAKAMGKKDVKFTAKEISGHIPKNLSKRNAYSNQYG